MLAYVFAGLALGSVYAIAASGLVITYISAGILNFAFGSTAFFLGRCYYHLNSERGWSALPALAVSVFAAGPLLGALLYVLVFRRLRLASSVVKIVSTIGLSVALPAAAAVLFGNATISTAPGLARQPVRIYTVLDTRITLDQVIATGSVLAVAVIGTALLRLTAIGLQVRAMVDSEALSALSGVDPVRISAAAWMTSTTLAGLAGVLAAPASGLTVSGMTGLMVVGFAAVVAGRLRSLPITVAVAMGTGIVTEVMQKYLPANSSLTAALVPSVPFVVMGVFLVGFTGAGGRLDDAEGTGGALDRAIRPMGADVGLHRAKLTGDSDGHKSFLGPASLLVLGGSLLLPMLVSGYWLNLVAAGFGYAVIFLSFTVVVGEGGMIWLCQAGFAGVGAIGAAQLATIHGWNPIVAALGAALIAVPFGVLIGLLTIRLGNLYVALATLSFGLLAETLVFTRRIFFADGIGVPITRPAGLGDDRSFAFFCLAVFVVVAVVVLNVQRSTTGLALAAVRSSEPAARTLGISVVGTKLLAAALSTFIAALGGALLALNYQSGLPSSYSTYTGLVWLAVVVSWGVRSIAAALLAGVTLNVLPGVFLTYFPPGFASLPVLLFGIGAVFATADPDGPGAAAARRVLRMIAEFAGPSDEWPAGGGGHGDRGGNAGGGVPTPVEIVDLDAGTSRRDGPWRRLPTS